MTICRAMRWHPTHHCIIPLKTYDQMRAIAIEEFPFCCSMIVIEVRCVGWVRTSSASDLKIWSVWLLSFGLQNKKKNRNNSNNNNKIKHLQIVKVHSTFGWSQGLFYEQIVVRHLHQHNYNAMMIHPSIARFFFSSILFCVLFNSYSVLLYDFVIFSFLRQFYDFSNGCCLTWSYGSVVVLLLSHTKYCCILLLCYVLIIIMIVNRWEDLYFFLALYFLFP